MISLDEITDLLLTVTMLNNTISVFFILFHCLSVLVHLYSLVYQVWVATIKVIEMSPAMRKGPDRLTTFYYGNVQLL